MSKHHSHELSEHPEVQWALDLLKPDPTYEPSVLSKYSTEIVLMLSGFAMPSFSNIYNSKPFYAGIQRHIMFVAGGYVLSQFVKKFVDDYQAERDTKLRDYIIRHPELFPEPERIKYSQVLEEWTPVR
ncbi:PREDICTED: NADH dehydrogenase [ubiquinone] 1 subunit C2 [Atta cephalotes]|uniref:NADH dehydrogenase [ubiquinone] 1 subunit C2 n=1 Tax=Atta cephalotes TaxID=12957 RepID=A0A158NSM5_ATTCE|nr:PREDICTED: NADH dehydrogenase [ubiquinone] 1 subunit C2 [Atta cephalotes]XP_018055769.1 PREDICTED: NADH dehydrogenase [ubiquinone] 1 subunit C2 [Atta colombica]